MTQQCPKDYFFLSLHSSSCSASCILRWFFWASQEGRQQLPATSLLIPVERSVCLRGSLSVRILRVTLIAPTEVTCPFLTNHCAWECPDWLSRGYLFGRNSFLVTSCFPKLKWDVLAREEQMLRRKPTNLYLIWNVAFVTQQVIQFLNIFIWLFTTLMQNILSNFSLTNVTFRRGQALP